MIFEEIYSEIRKKIPEKDREVVVIGVLGMPGSGKSVFSDQLSEHLMGKGILTVPWHSDIYGMKSRAERSEIMSEVKALKLKGKTCPNWPGKSYQYDVGLMARHLNKLKSRESFESNNLSNPQTKDLDLTIVVDFKKDGIFEYHHGDEVISGKGDKIWIICDGVFIGTKDSRKNFDFMIFIDSPFEKRLQRVKKRGLQMKKPINVSEDFFKDVDVYQENELEINKNHVNLVVDTSEGFGKWKLKI